MCGGMCMHHVHVESREPLVETVLSFYHVALEMIQVTRLSGEDTYPPSHHLSSLYFCDYHEELSRQQPETSSTSGSLAQVGLGLHHNSTFCLPITEEVSARLPAPAAVN